MRNLPEALQAKLKSGQCALAMLWTIERVDGRNFYFTDCDVKIVSKGNVYLPSAGGQRTAASMEAGLETDNMDITGCITDDSITEMDLFQGKFDYATARIDLVETSLPDAPMTLFRGKIGEVQFDRGTFKANMDGITAVYEQYHADTTAPECKAALGDALCKLNVSLASGRRVKGAIISVRNGQSFITNDLDSINFNNGTIHWLTGANAGTVSEIQRVSDTAQGTRLVSLCLPPNAQMDETDTYEAVWGCDHTIETCSAKFNNAVNFRGYPYLPGSDKIMQYGIK